MTQHRPLSTEALYHRCDPDQFDFTSTAELPTPDEPLGQNRALEAINFAIDIDNDGFNLFALGTSGLGKHELIKNILSQRSAQKSELFDWCYVNNFDNPQNPHVLKLPAGFGTKIRSDMEHLIEDLLTALPAAFQSDNYNNRLQELDKAYNQQQEKAFGALNDEAKSRNISILHTPPGYTLAPIVNDKVLDSREFKNLPQDEQENFETITAEIQTQLEDLIREQPIHQREQNKKINALRKEITKDTVDQYIGWIERRYEKFKNVQDYLSSVKQNVIDNLEDFLPPESEGETNTDNLKQTVSQYPEYSINVIVDNSISTGAPIIFEDNPTYHNLIGRVENIAQMGALVTDFTLIKAGALHRANGGFLVLDAHKVLINNYAWDGMKRTLFSHELKIESLEHMLSLASTITLEPESIPLDIKVILVGDPELYYLLKAQDSEFNLLFKVAADFSDNTNRNETSALLYARMIASLQKRHTLNPLDKTGVARVIEHASRLADDGEKLSLRVDTLSDLLCEANYWAKKLDSNLIRAKDIETALEKQNYRQNRIHETMDEQIIRGIRLIDTDDSVMAQVNALSVIQLGNYNFGSPSRITATVRLGKGDVIDIEREAELGGNIHSKGVLILSSYLGTTYAKDRPLPLSASLVFEQSYGIIEGDSASTAELCVLLSAIGKIPLKQSLAVTGSINQLGEVQAIGGVNEKIEGFFNLCQKQGLTGNQGVIIPTANQINLMLNQQVRDAVSTGTFSIYTASHIDDVMTLLSDLPEKKLEKGTAPELKFKQLIHDRIKELQGLKQQFSRKNTLP